MPGVGTPHLLLLWVRGTFWSDGRPNCVTGGGMKCGLLTYEEAVLWLARYHIAIPTSTAEVELSD